MAADDASLPADPPTKTRSSRDRDGDVTVAVIAGGILGAEARYGVGVAIPHDAAGFPWSTVVINTVGCFLLGVLMALLGQLSSPHRLLRPFVGVGIIGGFTTFSTFTVDTERLLEAHRPILAGLYVLCSVVFSIVAIVGATMITQAGSHYWWSRRIRRGDAARSRRRMMSEHERAMSDHERG